MSTEFIAFDYCGWNQQYGRFTHMPSGDTLLCRSGMDQTAWDKAQLDFFQKYPKINVYNCERPGPYNTDGKLMGSTEEICARLQARLEK